MLKLSLQKSLCLLPDDLVHMVAGYDDEQERNFICVVGSGDISSKHLLFQPGDVFHSDGNFYSSDACVSAARDSFRRGEDRMKILRVSTTNDLKANTRIEGWKLEPVYIRHVRATMHLPLHQKQYGSVAQLRYQYLPIWTRQPLVDVKDLKRYSTYLCTPPWEQGDAFYAERLLFIMHTLGQEMLEDPTDTIHGTYLLVNYLKL